MIKIRPITNIEIEQISEKALADNHGVIAPSHIVEHGTELGGCLSVGTIPLVLTWLNTANMRPLQSAEVFRQVERSLRFNGCRYVAYSCPRQSPFYDLAERAGYVKVVENGALMMKVL